MAPSLQRNKLIWLFATAVSSAVAHVWQKCQSHQRNVRISDTVPTGSSNPLLSIVCATDSSVGRRWTSDTLICFTLCGRMVALEDLRKRATGTSLRIIYGIRLAMCNEKQMVWRLFNQQCIFNYTHMQCMWFATGQLVCPAQWWWRWMGGGCNKTTKHNETHNGSRGCQKQKCMT